MARKRSLFDDKSEDIQQLTLVIKHDIGTLNRQIGQLQEVGYLSQISCFYYLSHSVIMVIFQVDLS